jgi:hypothetical protein
MVWGKRLVKFRSIDPVGIINDGFFEDFIIEVALWAIAIRDAVNRSVHEFAMKFAVDRDSGFICKLIQKRVRDQLGYFLVIFSCHRISLRQNLRVKDCFLVVLLDP